MTNVDENHSSKAFQSFLETVPLPWHNVFAINTLNQNYDCDLNIVAEAITANIKSLHNESKTNNTSEHAQPHPYTQKRKISSSDMPPNSSFKVRKYYRESADDILHLLDTISPNEDLDSSCNETLLSDIFNDVTEAKEQHEEEPSRSTESEPCPSPTTLKEKRLAKSSALTRSLESSRNLSNMDLSVITISSKASSADSSNYLCSSTERISTENEISEHSIPTNISVTGSYNFPQEAANVTKDSVLHSDTNFPNRSTSVSISDKFPQEAANITKDSVLNSDTLFPNRSKSDKFPQEAANKTNESILDSETLFPNRSTSVSISTCSSTDNLSQTSIPNDQGSENSTIINTDGKKSGIKDVYGWFVEMDHDRMVQNQANVGCDSTFSTATAPTSVL